MNFKANSPSPPLSVLSQTINTGRPSLTNTSIWNNGLPPIVTDQEDIQTGWSRVAKKKKKKITEVMLKKKKKVVQTVQKQILAH